MFEKMENAWHKTFDFFQDTKKIDLRTAAYTLAIRRILKAEYLRGR